MYYRHSKHAISLTFKITRITQYAVTELEIVPKDMLANYPRRIFTLLSCMRSRCNSRNNGKVHRNITQRVYKVLWTDIVLLKLAFEVNRIVVLVEVVINDLNPKMSAKNSFCFVVLLILVIEVIPIEIDLQEGEELKANNIDDSQLNECLSVRRSSEVGVCFGKELLHKLNKYDEADSFSLATGVSFIRDEKAPRDIGTFLDKDPMDFRYISIVLQ